jgi:hypothetical protein
MEQRFGYTKVLVSAKCFIFIFMFNVFLFYYVDEHNSIKKIVQSFLHVKQGFIQTFVLELRLMVSDVMKRQKHS